jgi:hypothetical protein
MANILWKIQRNLTQAFRRPSAACHCSTTHKQNQEEREWFEKDAAFQL